MNNWSTSATTTSIDHKMNSMDDKIDHYPVAGQHLPQPHQHHLSPQQQQQQQQQQAPSGFLPPPGLAPSSRPNTPVTATQNTSIDEGSILDIDRFGLNGLLSTIRMENIEQTKFTIGTDLNMLGLNLLETGKLSTTFETPWPEIIRTEVEPAFKFDDKFQDFELKNLSEDKFVNLSDETLFFIFYTRPNHYLQELASKQLNNRNWRFHKDLQLWLTKDSNVEPIQQNNQSERGIYIFFDPSSWEKVKKEFVLQYLSLHQVL